MAVRRAREFLALLSHPSLTGEETVLIGSEAAGSSVSKWRDLLSGLEPDSPLWEWSFELSLELADGTRSPLRMSDSLP